MQHDVEASNSEANTEILCDKLCFHPDIGNVLHGMPRPNPDSQLHLTSTYNEVNVPVQSGRRFLHRRATGGLGLLSLFGVALAACSYTRNYLPWLRARMVMAVRWTRGDHTLLIAIGRPSLVLTCTAEIQNYCSDAPKTVAVAQRLTPAFLSFIAEDSPSSEH